MESETATSSSPANQTRPAHRRNLSAWVSGGLLIIMAFAAGWVIVGSLFGASADSKDLTPVMTPGMRFRGLFGRQAAPVVPRTACAFVRTIRIRCAGDYTLHANKSAKDGSWSLRFTTDRNDLLTPEQDAAFTARWRLTHDSAYARSLGVNADQIAKLGQIQGKGGLIVEQADRDHLQQLLESYAAAAAPKTNEETALLAALTEICDRSIESTRKSLLERVGQIQSILTPEQLAKFR